MGGSLTKNTFFVFVALYLLGATSIWATLTQFGGFELNEEYPQSYTTVGEIIFDIIITFIFFILSLIILPFFLFSMIFLYPFGYAAIRLLGFLDSGSNQGGAGILRKRITASDDPSKIGKTYHVEIEDKY